MSESSNAFSGYSPPIAAELELGANKFCVASLSPDKIVLRDATPVAPSSGVVRLTVDGHTTVYYVELPEGIDPGRDEQPMRVIEALGAVA